MIFGVKVNTPTGGEQLKLVGGKDFGFNPVEREGLLPVLSH